MQDGYRIDYRFDFPGGESKTMTFALDRATLRLKPAALADPPEWARLDFHRCPVCQLSSAPDGLCPVAANMAQTVEDFKAYLSFDEVTVTVTTEDRSYVKQTPLQFGLSPMLGIIMVSSGCPTMEQLKPNVRFHLPFASLEETVYRSITMYLLGLFYRQRRGEQVTWSLDGLERLYAEVGEVNGAFAERLRVAARTDANINALVNLHCLGEMVTPSAESVLEQMEGYFTELINSKA